MTPQERRLIDELFDRLATLEGAPRDPQAVDGINEGLRRAPNALYALVQSVLVQDEALKRADARIRQLESELGSEPNPQDQQGGFLDGMRDRMFGRREGSVPSVPPVRQAGSAWNQPSQSQPPQAQPWSGGGAGAAQAPGTGGSSFLGTAAASVAGVVGGALLMNSMRGMFGGQQGQAHGAMGQGQQDTPWSSGGGGDLSRQAGLDDIGRSGGGASGNSGGNDRLGLFDTAQNDTGFNDDVGDDDFDVGDFSGDDTA